MKSTCKFKSSAFNCDTCVVVGFSPFDWSPSFYRPLKVVFTSSNGTEIPFSIIKPSARQYDAKPPIKGRVEVSGELVPFEWPNYQPMFNVIETTPEYHDDLEIQQVLSQMKVRLEFECVNADHVILSCRAFSVRNKQMNCTN